MNKYIREVVGLMLKEEVAYGGGGTLAGTSDGIQLSEFAIWKSAYLDDGKREFSVGTPDPEPRGPASGKFITLPVKTRMKGPGSTQSASVFSKDQHRLFRISGHTATLLASQFEYTPTLYVPGTVSYTSGFGEFYGVDVKCPFTGAFADLKISGKAGEYSIMEAEIMAQAGVAFSQAVPPAISYMESVIPPKLENAGFSIGSYTAGIIRSYEFGTNWKKSPRANANGASVHGGFSLISRTPYLKVVLEQADFVGTPFHGASALDPEELFRAAIKVSLGFTLGAAGANNRWIFASAANAAQLLEPPSWDDDDGNSIWTLTFQLAPSALAVSDAYKWTCGT